MNLYCIIFVVREQNCVNIINSAFNIRVIFPLSKNNLDTLSTNTYYVKGGDANSRVLVESSFYQKSIV